MSSAAVRSPSTYAASTGIEDLVGREALVVALVGAQLGGRRLREHVGGITGAGPIVLRCAQSR